MDCTDRGISLAASGPRGGIRDRVVVKNDGHTPGARSSAFNASSGIPSSLAGIGLTGPM